MRRKPLTHYAPIGERAHDPPVLRPLLIINHVTRELNINHMRSKHTHKIGFQSKVYSKQHRLKGQNMPKCGQRKAKMVLKSQSENQKSKNFSHRATRRKIQGKQKPNYE